jgi:hypothetical protein
MIVPASEDVVFAKLLMRRLASTLALPSCRPPNLTPSHFQSRAHEPRGLKAGEENGRLWMRLEGGALSPPARRSEPPSVFVSLTLLPPI